MQSHRAVVEQTIANIKLFKIMSSNKISDAAKFEITLDIVMALHNLRILLKLQPAFDMPRRRAAILGEHVFRPLVPKDEVDLKIPAQMPDLNNKKYHHIRAFKDFLPSVAKAMKDALARGEKSGKIFPTVLERAKNLYNGAYVLQYQVMSENENTWMVKYVVGASSSCTLVTSPSRKMKPHFSISVTVPAGK